MVIATTSGFTFDADGRQTGLGSRPEQIAWAADGSLRRLGVEVTGLYFQHRVNPELPIEEVAGAVREPHGTCGVSAWRRLTNGRSRQRRRGAKTTQGHSRLPGTP